MRSRFFFIALFFWFSAEAAAWMSPSPSVSPSSASSFPASYGPGKMSGTEMKQISGDFARAQKTELLAIEHQQSFEKSELTTAQRVYFKEWEKKEQDKRHEFFAAHPNGSDRRDYMKEFFTRRNELLKTQADERTHRLHEQDVHRTSLKEDQVVKAKEFEDYLSRGELPPKHLWPEGRR